MSKPPIRRFILLSMPLLCSGLSYGVGMDDMNPIITSKMSTETPFIVTNKNTAGKSFHSYPIFEESRTLTAVGGYRLGQYILSPLIMNRTSNIGTWVPVESDNITLPSDSTKLFDPDDSFSELKSVTCSGALCTAVGYYATKSGDVVPMILNSMDGGNSWTGVERSNIALPSDFLSWSLLQSVTCTGASCTAVGYYATKSGNVASAILNSTDDGNNWTGVEVTNIVLPSDYFFWSRLYSVTCSGTSCTAVGEYINTEWAYAPLILSSTDSGYSWTGVNPNSNLGGPSYTAPTSSDMRLYSVTCSGASCTAVGHYYNETRYVPLIIRTTDGIAWTAVEIDQISLPTDIDPGNSAGLSSVTCSGISCLAVGNYNNGTSAVPLILNNTVRGSSWTAVNTTHIKLPSDYNVDVYHSTDLNSVMCSGAWCTAVGEYTNSSSGSVPLILNSTDNGNTWIGVNKSSSPGNPGYTLPKDFVSDGILAGISAITKSILRPHTWLEKIQEERVSLAEPK